MAFLTRPPHFCSTSTNDMHTSGANASYILVLSIALPLPAMRIMCSNARAGEEA